MKEVDELRPYYTVSQKGKQISSINVYTCIDDLLLQGKAMESYRHINRLVDAVEGEGFSQRGAWNLYAIICKWPVDIHCKKIQGSNFCDNLEFWDGGGEVGVEVQEDMNHVCLDSCCCMARNQQNYKAIILH